MIFPHTACDWCGKDFVPTPENFVDAGVSMGYEPEPEDAWRHPSGMVRGEIPDIPKEHYDDVFATAKEHNPDLTDEQVHELLTTGKVEGLTQCVCFDCMDAAVPIDEENDIP